MDTNDTHNDYRLLAVARIPFGSLLREGERELGDPNAIYLLGSDSPR